MHTPAQVRPCCRVFARLIGSERADQPIVIPAGTRFEGRIECPGDIVIEGEIEGAIDAGGRVTIVKDGVCTANVRARSVEIYGTVIGNVVCDRDAKVAAGGRLVGDVRAPDVSVNADAELKGTVDELPPEPAAVAPIRVPAGLSSGELRRPAPPPRGAVYALPTG